MITLQIEDLYSCDVKVTEKSKNGYSRSGKFVILCIIIKGV